MTFEWITRVFISPVFFFVGLVLIALSIMGVYGAFAVKSAYIVVAALLFVLGFNAFRMGWKMFVTRQF